MTRMKANNGFSAQRRTACVVVFRMGSALCCAVGAVCAESRAGVLPPPPPGVQTFERYGTEFSVIGAPGNASFTGGPFGDNAGLGGVSYEYAMARTQVTNAQWATFANAYRPYLKGDPYLVGIVDGSFVQYDQATDRFYAAPGFEQAPAATSWRMAARYVNWLENDQRLTQDAFESGVYDTRTFSDRGVVPFTDQLLPNPNAHVRLPFVTESVKAGYYDPNRNGVGQGGYWRFPNRTDAQLRIGFPEDGGETLAGYNIPPGAPFLSWVLPVASYQQVQSPWGLFDISGSGGDWQAETPDATRSRLTFGSMRLDLAPYLSDSLDYFVVGAYDAAIDAPLIGIRLVTVVPAPGVAPLCLVAAITLKRRRT